MWLETAAILACLVATIYIFVKQRQTYFEKRGIPTTKPAFFFGHMLDSVLGQKSFDVVIIDHYNSIKNAKYIGIYNFLKPSVMIRDPDLIGDVLVKDFNHFADNDVTIEESIDYIMSKNIFALKGHHWKTTRSLITPMFSSGKLKYIFPLVDGVSKNMVRYVDREIDAGRGVCVNGKELCNKFTIDNVATCAFGLDGQAFEGETKFAMVAQTFSDTSYLNAIKTLLIFFFPGLNKYLKLKVFKDEIEEYIGGVLSETIKYRLENDIVRNDFLDHLNSLKEKSTEYPFTDRDVVAQAAGFFVDGVETSSGVMSYVLYEIARHPDVQRKIREEIRRVKAKHEDALTYEGLNDMHYLDAAINESVRLNGPGTALLKVCTKTYTLPEVSDDNKARLVLNPGDSVLIPNEGVHRDPEYFSEPAEYKPERFLAENKDNIRKHTFLGFGNGPRHCIGMRFGMLQIKMAVVALLENYKLDVNEKMLPYEVHPLASLKAPKKGFYFNFSKLA